MNQELDSALKTEIQRLVRSGIQNIQTIKVMLKTLVNNNIGTDVSDHYRAFFPTKKIIRNYVSKYYYASKQSKIHQIALGLKIEAWKKDFPENKYFYRPHKVEKNEAQSFLFCFQTQWQQNVMKRYGVIALIDSTNKTTKYSLPLFSLVVKTNVNYIIVGLFVVQYETGNSIAEVLQIFK